MVEEIVYVCPKCASKKWKFPSPLKLSTDMMEKAEKGEKILECRDCGFIGLFLKIQKNIN